MPKKHESNMKKFLLYFTTFCVCFSLCPLSLLADSPVTATPAPIQDISALLQPIVEKYDVPGMSAAIVNDQKVIAVGVAGVRARNSGSKITLEDSFHIGSNAKSMTATVIAMLVEKKLLQWNARVTDVFPELKGKIDPGYKDLTLEQLLTHRGGVPANLTYEEFQEKAHGNLVQARQMVMEEVLAKPPEATPKNFLYSNIGYIIAGHMAEKATGESWENLMATLLFSPLKMNSAGFGPPGKLQPLTQPVGHDENGNPVAIDNSPVAGPAGTVHLSILDWAKYVKLHLNGAQNHPQLLLSSSFQKLHYPISEPPPAYAMGWIVDESKWANGEVLVHAGSNTYWFAKVWIAPKRNLAILVACNDGSAKAQIACNQAGLVLMQSQLHLSEIKSLDPPKAEK